MQTCHVPPLPPFPAPLPLPKPTGACLSFDWRTPPSSSLLPYTDRCAERPSPPLTLILPRVGLSPHPTGFGSQHPVGSEPGRRVAPTLSRGRHGDRVAGTSHTHTHRAPVGSESSSSLSLFIQVMMQTPFNLSDLQLPSLSQAVIIMCLSTHTGFQ